MASLLFRPLPMLRLEEDEGAAVMSEAYWHDPYLSNSDTPRYEIVNLEPEYDFLSEDTPLSTGGSISDRIEGVLRHFRVLRAMVICPAKVRDYLFDYPELVKLLEYVVGTVGDHFSSGIQLSLEMYQDQETQYERLTLYIRQYIYDENTIPIIKKMRRDYHQLFPEMRGRFLLTTDFHAPR